MELLAILAFLTLIILAGGMVAAAFVHLPRLILARLAGNAPRWAIILMSYTASLLALKLFGSATSGMLFLLGFIFLLTSAYHLYWLLEGLGVLANAAIVGAAFLAVSVWSLILDHGRAVPIFPILQFGLSFT